MAEYSNHPKYAFDLVELINEYRESNGVQPLSVDHTLMDLSQSYTEMLKSTGQFTHTADGKYPWTRIADSGFDYADGLKGSDIGNENLHYGYSSRDGYHTPQDALEGWINSSGHNRNMLDPDWDRIGVGYGEGLYTANFGDAPDSTGSAAGDEAPTDETSEPAPTGGSFTPTRSATFETPEGRDADFVRLKLTDLVDESDSAGMVRIEVLNDGQTVATGAMNVSEPGGSFKIDHPEPFDQVRVRSAESDVFGTVADVEWTLLPGDDSAPADLERPTEDMFGPEDTVTVGAPDDRNADSVRITLSDVVDASGSTASIRLEALDDGRVVASQTASVREPGGTITFDPSAGFDEIRIRSPESDVTGLVDDIVFEFQDTDTGQVQEPDPDPQPAPAEDTSSIDDFERKVIELTNAERTERGLDPLGINAELNEAADRHAEDMAANNYFSHVGLDGDRAWDRGEEVGYSSQGYGENIAYGQDTPEEVVAAWMNSSGHRAAILNSSYTEIGVGYEQEYWVQNFGTGDLNPDSFLA